MIVLNELKKRYNEILAVDIDELRISRNKIFSFIGKNGAGKTTTIKMMLGILKPSNGYIYIDGKNMHIQEEAMDAKHKMAYIADTPLVYESLTGYEFIEFMASLYGCKITGELNKEIKSWLKKFEMLEKKDEVIGNYSHGTQQKVAIIAALIHKPELLILDEPTVGLDPQSIKILKDVLKEFARNGGTVFLSTHILSIAQEISDTFAIIDKGKIKYSGDINNIKTTFGEECTLESIFIKLTEDDGE